MGIADDWFIFHFVNGEWFLYFWRGHIYTDDNLSGI